MADVETMANDSHGPEHSFRRPHVAAVVIGSEQPETSLFNSAKHRPVPLNAAKHKIAGRGR